MFDSLDEQIRKDENKSSTVGQRMLRYALYAVAGLAVAVGLIYGIHFAK